MQANSSLALLSGMGGIGKTELAQMYSHNHYKNYKCFAWINYVSDLRESLITNISEETIVKKLDEKQEMEDKHILMKDIITNLPEETLFIIDNFDNLDDKYFREFMGNHMDIIVTSRNKVDGINELNIKPLKVDECIKLFLEYCDDDSCDIEIVKKIIKLASYHTLTIELLARTMEASGYEVQEFYELLVERGFNLTGIIDETTSLLWHGDTEKRKLIEHLKKVFDISNLSKMEKYILVNLSVIPSAPFKKREVKKMIGLDNLESLNSLIKKGWLKKEGKQVEIHNVIQEVVRELIDSKFNKFKNIVSYYSKSLNYSENENPLLKIQFIEGAASILRYCRDENDEIATLNTNLALVYLVTGNLKKALKKANVSLKIRKRINDDMNVNLAIAYGNQGNIYQALGDYKKALLNVEEAKNIFENMQNDVPNYLAICYGNLSNIYQNLKMFEEALNYAKKGKLIFIKCYGEEYSDVATSNNNIAQIYQSLGKFDKSLEYSKKCLNYREKYLSLSHPDLIKTYNNVSQIYRKIGKLEKSLDYAEKALSCIDKPSSVETPISGMVYGNLGSVYLEMNRDKESLECFIKSIDIFKKFLGEEHPDTAISYINIGRFYFKNENYERSTKYFEKAVKIMKTKYPNGHPNLLLALEWLNESKKRQIL